MGPLLIPAVSNYCTLMYVAEENLTLGREGPSVSSIYVKEKNFAEHI